jgi:hypothetical protein
MAYWRRYRKCSAEASALALHDSSSDGETDQFQDCSGTLSSLEIDPTSCAPDKVNVEDSFNASSSSLCDNQAGTYSIR